MRIVLSIVTAVASWLHLQNTEREEESERVIRVSKVYLNYLCITIFDIDEIKKWALQQKSKNYNTIVQVRHKTELDSQAVRGRVTTCNLCQTVLSGCYISDMFLQAVVHIGSPHVQILSIADSQSYQWRLISTIMRSVSNRSMSSSHHSQYHALSVKYRLARNTPSLAEMAR